MHLHLISFNVPYPADYGGVIDVFYKISALRDLGVKVILHCFKYGREEAAALKEICEEVHHYKRETGWLNQLSVLPFIVKTRRNKELLERLQGDDYPILFEGLHCSYFLGHPSLRGRKKFLRMHNVEWQYYAHLAKTESSVWKKLYFALESARLMRYEGMAVASATHLLAISAQDKKYFKDRYPKALVNLVPAFHPSDEVQILEGMGEYALYQGDLSVSDNERSVIFLVNEVFAKTDVPFVIAGRNPSKKIEFLVEKYDNISLRANPTEEEMQSFVLNAQVHVLYSFQSAGMKLKMLRVLHNGRFCIANREMVGEEFGEVVNVANTADEILSAVEKSWGQVFSKEQIKKREDFLTPFSNKYGVEEIVGLLNS